MKQETGLLQLPQGIGAALRYLEGVLQTIQQRVDEIDRSLFQVSTAEPERPRDFMIRCADGTNWNPGYGAGLYQYRSGTWYPLGSASQLFSGSEWNQL